MMNMSDYAGIDVPMDCSCHVRLFGVVLESQVSHTAQVTTDYRIATVGSTATLQLIIKGRTNVIEQVVLDCWVVTNKGYISQRIVSTWAE